MDVRYTHNNIAFVWDEDKARLNRQKHGVQFEIAVKRNATGREKSLYYEYQQP